MHLLLRLLAALPLLLISPILVLLPLVALGVTDICWVFFGRRRMVGLKQPSTSAASIVIPNWNGKDLLQKYIPSVLAATEHNPLNEVIVVDNASDDGSAQFLRDHFPKVRVVALPRNEGFGGGSNAGFSAAQNDIVVLLNSDMRVEKNFLEPLLESFTNPQVFAVSCQIFFSDPNKLREETGLTQAWWESGRLKVRHRIDEQVREAYPCFYGGGGSSAFDRRKFLELGGFDDILAPFYLEDTDLGYMAWKRGWQVLYQPRSVVYHEHRGTIGKKFSQEYIDRILKKNFALFCWKNIHEWPRLLGHFGFAWADGILSAIFGDSRERSNLPGLARACLQLPGAVRSRWQARSLAMVSDTEAFRRPLGGYFRDRFQQIEPNPKRLSVLFVSPYPICPPVHGGGVFMYQTTTALSRLCDLHLLVLLDHAHQQAAHQELVDRCASAEFIVRMPGRQQGVASVLPHAVSEFSNADLEWLIHRQIYNHEVDVLQLEYTPLGQYSCKFDRLASVLFEHDIYFQSIARQLPNMPVNKKMHAAFEYLRALRYELKLLPQVDRIQVCSKDNRDVIESFLPRLRTRIDDNLRAGIDTSSYPCRTEGRERNTMLFVGSFRHLPNQEAVNWFTRQVLPLILEQKPEARLVVVGSDPPPKHSLPDLPGAIELRGFVEDVLEPLGRYSLFVCPVRSGSGMRVKLLEAFAAGIPVVSTRVGAEGLAENDGEFCELSDDPATFAGKVVRLLDDLDAARLMATRARLYVEQTRDMVAITEQLEASYRRLLQEKRS
jgi:GT2 family glycosyltransferase/glycosyltransferase involved in cell wall biosynthesis